ncbi:helix-turn-helix domain-containing protein [Simkania negevensis]|uniref:HTH cro/C1-type domain-containing protein n=1 Tax=Simkania negevensis (strain ATCC VR-1471 / DSM 27360 / Z) TaxID=331113 RepID=F8L2Q5_SIMNZ|nr:helix-turn-helix transcriptional regulator [Simkania negevensis]CCB87751.1 unknown protein [Simkania negevensis Z]
MELKEYLESNGIKHKYFAEKVGISPQSLSDLVNKKTAPRQKTAQKIVELTKGEVTFEDLFKEKE